MKGSEVSNAPLGSQNVRHSAGSNASRTPRLWVFVVCGGLTLSPLLALASLSASSFEGNELPDADYRFPILVNTGEWSFGF